MDVHPTNGDLDGGSNTHDVSFFASVRTASWFVSRPHEWYEAGNGSQPFQQIRVIFVILGSFWGIRRRGYL